MFFSLDRFEEEWAVLVDDEENSHIVPHTLLPADTQPGDVLWGENGTYARHAEETARRRAYVQALEQQLRE